MASNPCPPVDRPPGFFDSESKTFKPIQFWWRAGRRRWSLINERIVTKVQFCRFWSSHSVVLVTYEGNLSACIVSNQFSTLVLSLTIIQLQMVLGTYANMTVQACNFMGVRHWIVSLLSNHIYPWTFPYTSDIPIFAIGEVFITFLKVNFVNTPLFKGLQTSTHANCGPSSSSSSRRVACHCKFCTAHQMPTGMDKVTRGLI